MTIFKPNQLPVNARVAGFIAIVVSMLMAVGCAKNYGGFSLDAEVTRAFEAGDVQSDLAYYYAGRDNMPYAIMGIDRNYRVPSRYWIPFEPQPEQLKNMSGNVYGKHRYDPYGAHIRDANGNVVGVWYSNVNFRSVTVDQENKTVEIIFPNPENDGGGSTSLRVSTR